MAWTLELSDATCLTNHWGKKYNCNCHNFNVLQWGSTEQIFKKKPQQHWQQTKTNDSKMLEIDKNVSLKKIEIKTCIHKFGFYL